MSYCLRCQRFPCECAVPPVRPVGQFADGELPPFAPDAPVAPDETEEIERGVKDRDRDDYALGPAFKLDGGRPARTRYRYLRQRLARRIAPWL